MAEKHGTSIEWTHGEGRRGETWNPVVGCSKVSPGCAHCYAEELHRTRLDGSGVYPAFKPWTPENAEHNVTLVPDRLGDPLSWRKPRMVFVNSMSDLFHELVPDAYVLQVFEVMRRCPQHTFQVLTKRPDRMAALVSQLAWRTPTTDERHNDSRSHGGFRAYLGEPGSRPLPNVWLGTSIENRRYVGRADDLRATPAAVRFISAEPLLGPLTYDDTYMERDTGAHVPCWSDGPAKRGGSDGPELELDGIDWLIVGGESGPKHRPMRLEWVRDLREAAADAGTAFFLKQIGGRTPKANGRELDGRTWDEMPTPVAA